MRELVGAAHKLVARAEATSTARRADSRTPSASRPGQFVASFERYRSGCAGAGGCPAGPATEMSANASGRPSRSNHANHARSSRSEFGDQQLAALGKRRLAELEIAQEARDRRAARGAPQRRAVRPVLREVVEAQVQQRGREHVRPFLGRLAASRVHVHVTVRGNRRPAVRGDAGSAAPDDVRVVEHPGEERNLPHHPVPGVERPVAGSGAFLRCLRAATARATPSSSLRSDAADRA